jgi:pimeloyl-ACP methyl ester carboxylesterase
MRLEIRAANVDPERSHLLVLRDGRRLGYAEWGDPGGVPVVHFHGMPGSRLETHASTADYRRLGVRLVTVDRPGYGLSDRSPRRRLIDWPDDVAQLADALALERFGLTALSGGGPFALACAARFPERLLGVAIAGCIAPLDAEWALRGIKWQNRLGLSLARRAPWALTLGYRGLKQLLSRSPDAFVMAMTRDKPDSDQLWLRRPEVRRQLEDMLVEAVRGGVLGAVQEVGLLARPWGFRLEEIRVPVDLYHGDRDDTAPLEHARYLARTIPGARLHVCPGEGHMVMWSHVEDVLAVATGRARRVRSGGLVAAF